MSGFAAGPFSNGAAVLARMDVRTMKFDVYRCDGERIASKRDLAAAVVLAQSLPDAEALGLEPVLPMPSLSWSPRPSAQLRRVEVEGGAAAPVQDIEDGGPDRSMSEARRRSGVGPSGRNPTALLRPKQRA
jgi:hypothetical protein